MGQCKLCQKSGFFVGVDKNGLCASCAPKVALEKKERFRVIQESIKIAQNSKKLDTQLSRLDLVVEYATALKRYEDIGIKISDPPISTLIDEYKRIHDPLILEALEEEYITILPSLDSSTISSTLKISKLNKLITKSKGYQSKLYDPEFIDTFIEKVDGNVHEIKLNSYIAAAEKAEFKGSKKKAIDQYLEALYFLKTDDIDDILQKDQIDALETKIEELKRE